MHSQESFNRQLTSLTLSCQTYYTKLTKKYNKTSLLNIIEFTESTDIGLGFILYPMQKLIFKLMFRLPLSNSLKENTIEIPDKYNEKVILRLTEIETIDYLYSEKAINMSYKEYMNSQEVFIEILFFIGRRGSKTTMVSIIYSYQLYLLIKIRNPHRYFNVTTSDPIGLIVVSNTGDGADRQFESLKQIINTCKFFQPHLRGTKGSILYLASPRLLQQETNQTNPKGGDIKIVASPATSKVRGTSAILVGMDEYCHFRDVAVKNKALPLDKQIHEALTPAVSGFVTPQGEAFGKAFVFSSPNGKRGEGYKKYQTSFTRKEILMIKTPSHWVNRNLASQFIRKMYEESERSARQEYGAEFLDILGDYISNPHRLKAMVNTLWTNTVRNAKKEGRYNLSVDLAQSGDGLVFCVTHKEKLRPQHTPPQPPEDYEGIDYQTYLAQENIIVVDYYLKITPEEEGGVISHGIIIAIFKTLYKAFNIIKTTIDQWNYQVYAELIQKEDITNMETFELFLATEMLNSLVAKTFTRLMSEGRLMLPETFITDGTFEDFLSLSEILKSNNMIKVMAIGSGEHDDTYSAMSRSCMMSETQGEAQDLIIGSSLLTTNQAQRDINKAEDMEQVRKMLAKIKDLEAKPLILKKWSK